MIFPAISIRQPWAEAILSCGKDVENRSWKCPQKYIGRTILLHTGKNVDRFVNTEIYYPELHKRVLGGYNTGKIDSPRTGGIVGAFVIVSDGSAAHDVNNKWADPLCYQWRLALAVRIPFFPCKGRLRFFEVDYPDAFQVGLTPESIV